MKWISLLDQGGLKVETCCPDRKTEVSFVLSSFQMIHYILFVFYYVTLIFTISSGMFVIADQSNLLIWDKIIRGRSIQIGDLVKDITLTTLDKVPHV